MLIGHYAASLAGRRSADSTPLWLCVAGAQLLDIAWSVFVMSGLERVEADSSVPEGLAFTFHPYSHSLAAAIAWSVAAAIVARKALRIEARDAFILALVVLSHWLLDLVAHRADLPLWPGSGAKLGLGLWNQLQLELGVEIVLFLAAGIWLWSAARPVYPYKGRLLAFLGFGALFMLATSRVPPPAEIDPVAVGAMSLAMHLLFVFLAWLVERPRRTHSDAG